VHAPTVRGGGTGRCGFTSRRDGRLIISVIMDDGTPLINRDCLSAIQGGVRHPEPDWLA
jgi:hypothetical protein